MEGIIKRLLVGSGFVAVVLLGMSGYASKGPLGELRLEALLKEAEKKAYIVNQFGTDFVKTKHSTLFKRDMIVRGHLVFQKPDKLKLALAGDVNVEILANGKTVTLIHDSKDMETFQVKAESDSSRFSDPLMQLINGLGNRLLKEFKVKQRVVEGEGLVLEVSPGSSPEFEAIDRVFLWLADGGRIDKGKVLFKNGNYDETVFERWVMLPRDDPEILDLNSRLERLAGLSSSTKKEPVSSTPGPVSTLDRSLRAR